MSKTKKLCILSMLTAICVILSAYLTVRVGLGIKISFKFIPVFFTAVIAGPLWSGAVAAASDIISILLNPVGAFLPAVSAIEFLYGLSFGLFFYKREINFKKLTLCTALQILVINLFATSFFLKVYFGNSYIAAVSGRFLSAAVNFAVQTAVLLLISKKKITDKAGNFIE